MEYLFVRYMICRSNKCILSAYMPSIGHRTHKTLPFSLVNDTFLVSFGSFINDQNFRTDAHVTPTSSVVC